MQCLFFLFLSNLIYSTNEDKIEKSSNRMRHTSLLSISQFHINSVKNEVSLEIQNMILDFSKMFQNINRYFNPRQIYYFIDQLRYLIKTIQTHEIFNESPIENLIILFQNAKLSISNNNLLLSKTKSEVDLYLPNVNALFNKIVDILDLHKVSDAKQSIIKTNLAIAINNIENFVESSGCIKDILLKHMKINKDIIKKYFYFIKTH